MPSRRNAIPLVVDIGDIEVQASLRQQRGRAGNWNVRFRMDGKVIEKSTETPVLSEAKRIARQIIRGESPKPKNATVSDCGLTISQFEQIQRAHHQRNGRPEAGEASFSEFMGTWRSFLRVCPVATIPEVTEHVALQYLRALMSMSKSQNRSGEKKSSEPLSIRTIHKHIRTLGAAWNRIRSGHRARVGGLTESQVVAANPWEAIHNNLPQVGVDDEEPVQFELGNNDLGLFLDQFKERPVGELFIITSLWCWGRITEMTRMEWSWFKGDYVVIPNSQAKKGRGKIARLPPAIREQIQAIRVPSNPYVFARWEDDVRKASTFPSRIQPFDPRRMVNQMEKLICGFADSIGRPEISHHALRRTVMELGNVAGLEAAERQCAEELQTTHGNMTRNYIQRFGKKAVALADALYSNLTSALHEYPNLAMRLGCEPMDVLAEREAEASMKRLTPLQRQRLAKRLLGEGTA